MAGTEFKRRTRYNQTEMSRSLADKYCVDDHGDILDAILDLWSRKDRGLGSAYRTRGMDSRTGNPRRWSRATRGWLDPERVWLNPPPKAATTAREAASRATTKLKSI
jgi:hypothetical protein